MSQNIDLTFCCDKNDISGTMIFEAAYFQKMSHSDFARQKAYSLYIRGVSIQAIATEIGISRRSIERWRNAGKWDADLPGKKELPEKSEIKVVDIGSVQPRKPCEPRRHKKIDELLIVEEAVESLAELLQRENISANSPGIGSTASALVRLLEYRRKIAPPTAALLAEQVVDLGISPTEFVAELKKTWQLQQKA